MGLILCEGRPVSTLRLALPSLGAWTYDVEIADPDSLSGLVTLKEGTLSWIGTVARSRAHAGRTRARVVGGKGGLAKIVDCQHYRDVQASEIVQALLAEAGESLSSTADTSLLRTRLDHWTRWGDTTAGLALESLADKLGAGWRVLADGTIWIGAETYPTQTIDEANELDRMDDIGEATLATGSMALRPGVTFSGRRVLDVLHVAGAGSVRTHYSFELS